MNDIHESSNQAYSLSLALAGDALQARLTDRIAQTVWAEGPYRHSLQVRHPDGVLDGRVLRDAALRRDDRGLELTARIGGLTLEQRWDLPADQAWMEETIRLTNKGDEAITVTGIECGFLRRVADGVGRLYGGCEGERLVAIPFRKRPTDPAGWINDHGLGDLLRL